MSDLANPSLSQPPHNYSIRWWPVVGIFLASAIACLVVFTIPHPSRQHLNIQLAQVFFFTFGALLIWLIFGSRLRKKIRILLLAGILILIGGIAASFRIHGVTGNLVPILEPRWASHRLQAPIVIAATNKQLVASIPGASDFPQFLGPTRNGILIGPRLQTNWTTHPPSLLWRQPIGTAWSGFVVSGSLAITQEQRGEEELVVAYELLTGKVVWSHNSKTRYFTTLAGEGPRANPSIARGRVFAQGATGILSCLDLATGRLIWEKDILQENQARVPGWGQSSSPLVMDDLVVVSTGARQDRSLVAYRCGDGAPAWSAGSDDETYCSPTLLTLAGIPQIVLFSDSLISHDPATGKELWRFAWPHGHPHVAMPVQVNGTDLIVSSGYGTGSGRVRVQRDSSGVWNAAPVWRTNRLKAKFTNPVLFGHYIFGLDDGILACLDAETGDQRWKDGRYGHGQTLLVRDLLLVTAENGEVLLVDPQPDRLRELCKSPSLSGKTWNPPALAGEYLVVRNDKEAACYRLPSY